MQKKKKVGFNKIQSLVEGSFESRSSILKVQRCPGSDHYSICIVLCDSARPCHCENVGENDTGFSLSVNVKFQTIISQQRKLCFWLFFPYFIFPEWGPVA